MAGTGWPVLLLGLLRQMFRRELEQYRDWVASTSPCSFDQSWTMTEALMLFELGY